jgi:tryptophan halogenase
LRRRLNIKVDVIHSKNIGIVGVGEGSTEHFKEYMEFMNINQYDIIKYCDATYKSGIMFEGWNDDKPYLHSIISKFDKTFSQYNYVYAKQISENDQYVNYKSIWENKINNWFVDKPSEIPFGQFHFNTFKLNDFLEQHCKLKDIDIIDDEIVDVTIDNNIIKSISGEKQTYHADFFIDSTGFKRFLISKLGATWQSYSQWLKMKEVIAFQTPDTDNYNAYTLCRAMKYGWMFRIPVWGRWGNGYVFDSNYITKEQAQQEVEEYLGHTINVARNIKFDPGCLDTTWVGNCVAVGLSANFVEPLEATSIGSTINQVFLLTNYLNNYTDDSIKQYNTKVTNIMENIRDFIILHYMVDKDESDFWKDIKNIKIPDSLRAKLDRWQHSLPIREDFLSTNYLLFFEQNWINVLYGMDKFNTASIKGEFESLTSEFKDKTRDVAFEQLVSSLVTHKQYLKHLRARNGVPD